MFTEITRVSEDKFQSHLWRFQLSLRYGKLELQLWAYLNRSRRTTRCKWVNDEIYSRLDRRNNTIKIDEVSIPEDVEKEFKQILHKQIDEATIQI